MRLIDADAFENYVFDEWMKNEVSNGDWVQFREWLKDQQTIIEFQEPITKVVVMGTEYVPLIRCKDCKHSEHWYSDRSRCFLLAESGISVFDYGFCNYAERKKE